jgi:ParB family chromosome partitioning protein
MNARRGGLGRGLGALIPGSGQPPVSRETSPTTRDRAAVDGAAADRATAPAGVRLLELRLADVDANPGQPRTVFDEDTLAELAQSIREVGVLQPIVVRPSSAAGRYEIVMGERRFRASALADRTTIPAIVRETSDDDLLRDALLENLHREQLNPLEEAAAYKQLLEDFGATHDQLAQRVGKSRAHVSNTLRLMNLPGKVQARVAAGVLAAGHARALLGLEDADEQDRLAARIVAEGLSVRAVEEIVAMRGTEPAAPPGTARRRAVRRESAIADDVALALESRLDTRVRVDVGRGKGKIVIDFAGEDDLERIALLLRGSDT